MRRRLRTPIHPPRGRRRYADDMKLGRQGLELSAIGLGCMGMSDSYGRGTTRIGHDAAPRYRAGMQFLRYGRIYGPFKNEQLLGGVIEGRRDRSSSPPNSASISPAGILPTPTAGHRISASRRCLAETAPDRLNRPFYQHRVDPKAPIEEVAGAVEELMRPARSATSACRKRGERSAGLMRTAGFGVQTEYSLWERNFDEDVIPLLRELGIGFVPSARSAAVSSRGRQACRGACGR